jgi:hypothetical protein
VDKNYGYAISDSICKVYGYYYRKLMVDNLFTVVGAGRGEVAGQRQGDGGRLRTLA